MKIERHKEFQAADGEKQKIDWKEEVKITPEHEEHPEDIVDMLSEF